MGQPYESLEAELHDAFWAAEAENEELGLMRNFLRRHPGRALEIGCGSGRLLLPLAGEGFPIEGLDISADMLALARACGAEKEVFPTLHQADMETWEPEKIYSSVLAPAFTLQLAEDPEAVLRRWKSWLEPGGALFLTVFIPFAEIEGELPEGRWYHDHDAEFPDGRQGVLETRHRLDFDGRLVTRDHRYTMMHPDGVVAHHASVQRIRWWFPEELAALLAGCGFRVAAKSFDFSDQLAGPDEEYEEWDGILTVEALI